MNRIGVMVDSFRLGVIKGIEAARRVGAGAAQIYVGGRGAVKDVWTPALRRDVAACLNDNALKLAAMCGDMGGHGFELESEAAWRVDETRRMFDLTRELGGDVLTTHIGVVPEDKSAPRRAVMLNSLSRLGEYGRACGCRIAIETGPERPVTLRAFLDEIHSDFVGVNYDPANLKMVLDEDPVAGVAVLADKIFHTHAKDGKMLKYLGPETVYGFFADGGIEDVRIEECFLETPLGEGQVNFPAWIRALDQAGYTGFITIEREVGADPYGDIQKAVRFLEKLI